MVLGCVVGGGDVGEDCVVVVVLMFGDVVG